MVSNKQIKANQNNAKLGGVKTSEGKAVSRFNAQIHGIMRQSLAEYEEGHFEDILQELNHHYKPRGIVQKIIIERIAICYLKLFRAQKAEAEYIKAHLNPRITRKAYDISHILSGEEIVQNEGYVPKLTEDGMQRLLEIYSRYETTLENRMFRAIHELERSQKIGTAEKFTHIETTEINQMGSFGETVQINQLS